MNTDFPRILTLLRKERGISQKQAAAELEISQALLSHYEKGIRECGLEFVVKTADFYGVSCDYLLGRSPVRTGVKIAVDEIPDPEAAGKENRLKGSILPTLNKKLIFNSLNIVFDLLQALNDKQMTQEISTFLDMAVYRIFRVIYNINNKNEETLFTTQADNARARATAAMIICEGAVSARVKELKGMNAPAVDKLYISTETIARDYPMFNASLLNLINSAEKHINEKFE